LHHPDEFLQIAFLLSVVTVMTQDIRKEQTMFYSLGKNNTFQFVNTVLPKPLQVTAEAFTQKIHGCMFSSRVTFLSHSILLISKSF